MEESQSLIHAQAGQTKLYRQIIGNKYFKGGEKGEINLTLVFCLAVAIGFQENKYQPLVNKEYITRTEYIKKNNHMLCFLQSIAIVHDKSLAIINNLPKVFEIAEGYANGGIKILYAKVFNAGKDADFDKELELKFNIILKKYFLKNND